MDFSYDFALYVATVDMRLRTDSEFASKVKRYRTVWTITDYITAQQMIIPPESPIGFPLCDRCLNKSHEDVKALCLACVPEYVEEKVDSRWMLLLVEMWGKLTSQTEGAA